MVFSPKHCRLTEHCTPRTFKQLLMCATQHDPALSAEEIADRAGIPLKWLYDYANEGQPNRNIPAAKLQRVVEVTGRIDLFRFLLLPLGHTTMPIGATLSTERVFDEVLDVQDATGDLLKSSRPLAGGRALTDDQLEAIETNAIRVQNEAGEALAAVRAKRSGVPVRIVAGGSR